MMSHGLTPEDEIRALLELESQDGITLEQMKARIDEGRDGFHDRLQQLGLGWIAHTSKGSLLRAIENMDDVITDNRRGGDDLMHLDPARSMETYYKLLKNNDKED